MAIVRRRIDPRNPPPLSDEERAQLARLDALTPEQIERNALEDPDNPPWTDEEFERAFFARDVRSAREKLGLTQAQFAERFHIGLARLRDWEQGRHQPDSAAKAYVKVIAREPEAVARALAADAPKGAAAE
ncbi:MAG TPA: helix-turn-helix domain-containing protein [Beijerinckiaceae bacterium]|jgi:putative transcriptional regulator